MRFLDRRLQVFVSSTYLDLIQERQAAVEAILTAGHIPAGMELFTAGDQSQMEVIEQWIDESDVYMVIIGGCYGSVEKTSGKSYTQLEYEYAMSRGKPVFACVVENEAMERRVREFGTKVIEKENPKQMRLFRDLVLSKIVKFWSDPKDIKIAVGETLSQFMRTYNLQGWVPAETKADIPALTEEVTRLSRENSELRKRIESQQSQGDYVGFSYKELKDYLTKEKLLEPVLATISLHPTGSILSEEHNLKYLAEIHRLGLLKQVAFSGKEAVYELSDDGRRFFNRLKVLEAKNDHPV